MKVKEVVAEEERGYVPGVLKGVDQALIGIPDRFRGPILALALQITRGCTKRDFHRCANELWHRGRYVQDADGITMEQAIRRAAPLRPGPLWTQDLCGALIENGDLISTLRARRVELDRLIGQLERIFGEEGT